MSMSRLYDLQKFCRGERAWLVETTEALVRLESPTTDKAAVDRCGRELESRLGAIGGLVTRLTRPDRGDHLLAEFPAASLGAGGRRPSQILLLGHFDRVWPVGQLQRSGGDAMRLDTAIRGLAATDGRTSMEMSGGVDRPPLERSAGVVRLYEQARQVARELGSDLAEGGTGGGSDGNFTAALGVSTLDGLGAIGDGAHALHEYVEVEALPDRAALVAGLIAGMR